MSLDLPFFCLLPELCLLCSSDTAPAWGCRTSLKLTDEDACTRTIREPELDVCEDAVVSGTFNKKAVTCCCPRTINCKKSNLFQNHTLRTPSHSTIRNLTSADLLSNIVT
ncbi:hypothetical protein XPA_001184 [Xanthoria parietina]